MGGLLVQSFEHAPLARARPHMFLHKLVDLGADPPDDLASALGEPKLGPSMPEPRVLLRVEQPVDLVLQGRNPGEVVGIDRPGEVDESLAVGVGPHRTDGNWSTGHAGGLAARGHFVTPAKTTPTTPL